MSPIDLRSDTITLPTDEMIEAIVQAHEKCRLGDDVLEEDDVTNELQDKVATLLGKEAALLVTSGTQANLVSMLAQTKRGDEVILEEMSHTFLFEGGGMSSLGGLYPKPVKGVRGYIQPEMLEAAIKPDNVHYATATLVSMENTHNYAGGTVTTRSQTEALAKVAHENNLLVHCDGARLFNAVVALDIQAKDLVKLVDSVMICLSKGLSAPVGSVIAGTAEFIHEARKIRKRLGGGMRQSGIIAAPGIVAIEKMVDRLKEDHANAKLLYKRLAKIPGLIIEEPDTNILFIGLDNFNIDAPSLSQELEKRSILVYGQYGERIRFVLNRMVSQEDTIETANAVEEILT